MLAWLLISNVGWVDAWLPDTGPVASIYQTFPKHVGLSNLDPLNRLHIIVELVPGRHWIQNEVHSLLLVHLRWYHIIEMRRICVLISDLAVVASSTQ